LIGVALYWVEGAKKNADRAGTLVDFSNSDPAMVRFFVRWLKRYCNLSENQIQLRLHLHESHKSREKAIKAIWANHTDLPIQSFTKTLYKTHNPKTKRHKIGLEYIGLVSV